MPPQRATTVAERLRLMSGELTAAERKLMASLFANYPMAGLGSITDFERGGCLHALGAAAGQEAGFRGLSVLSGRVALGAFRPAAEPDFQA